MQSFVMLNGKNEITMFKKESVVDCGEITDQDFDEILANMMDESPASHLLFVPGIYEAVSEHFNNAVLDKWAAHREED